MEVGDTEVLNSKVDNSLVTALINKLKATIFPYQK